MMAVSMDCYSLNTYVRQMRGDSISASGMRTIKKGDFCGYPVDQT